MVVGGVGYGSEEAIYLAGHSGLFDVRKPHLRASKCNARTCLQDSEYHGAFQHNNLWVYWENGVKVLIW